MSEPAGGAHPLLELERVMARLRAECPWKAAQTHASLLRYLLEEAHEVVEAVETAPERSPAAADEHLREELGDLLLQVYFHAAIAAQEQRFDIGDVARGLVEKLVRRNPHVFGPDAAHDPAARAPDAGGLDAAAVNEAWEAVKAQEKQRRHPLEGIAPTLPALLAADKALDRWSRAGVDAGLRPGSDDVGERLLGLVAEARAEGVDPEQALRAAIRRRGGASPDGLDDPGAPRR